MAIKHDVHASILILLIFQLFLAFGAIGLLERMSSKIHIHSTLNTDLVTEASIELTHEQTQEAYHELLYSNQEAKRLGTAGAWALVLLGFSGFVITIALIVRLNRNVVNPIQELQSALKDWRSGNRFRRCTTTLSPPPLAAAMTVVNQLLDDYCEPEVKTNTQPEDLGREITLHLLESSEKPMLIINQSGQIKTANNLALGILSRPKAAKTRDQLTLVPKGEIGFDIESATRIGNQDLWHCILKT